MPVYHFGGNSTDDFETKPNVSSVNVSVSTPVSSKKPMQSITWSNASIPELQKYTLGAPVVRKISEGYVIIEMCWIDERLLTIYTHVLFKHWGSSTDMNKPGSHIAVISVIKF